MEKADLESVGADEDDWWRGTKARVFISCGQKFTYEKETARRLRELVRKLGFAPYLAFEIHSSKSLSEGIHDHLRTAEYFLFVDFARERIGWLGPRRGSLFPNQELAIASYLQIDSLYFVEDGIAPREGIIGVIQGNAVPFSRRDEVIPVVERAIGEALWDNKQRNEVRIEPAAHGITHSLLGGVSPTQYFHLALHNLSRKTFASGCMVQIEAVRDLTRGTAAPRDMVEMKFKHITWPVVGIPPNSVRQFDGMLIQLAKPSEAILGILSSPYIDSGAIIGQYTLTQPGDYEVDIVSYSREFRPDRATIQIHIDTTVSGASLKLKPSP